MKVIKSIPMFGVILVVYTMFMTVSYQSNPNLDPMKVIMFAIKLPSQQFWRPDIGDAIVVVGLFILFLEIIKSTSTSANTITEHILSTFVFMFYIIAFLLAPMVANSTFLILGIMSMIDVIAGFTITAYGAKRDISIG